MTALFANVLDGERIILPEETVEQFRGSLQGLLLTPNHSDYETVRKVWNGMIDRHPALIVCCTSAADVIAAVNFARTHHLLTAVRAGGHGVAGTAMCEGGIVIDLAQMRAVHVDPEARSARVEGGATLGDLDRATQVFGLATPTGQVSLTGIAGLTLGGGIGWLRRKYGLSCDNLLSVEIVTADGQLLTASATENPDLFWGVRGGGGNFGVVTTFEFKLHPIGPQIMLAGVFYPVERAKEILRFFRSYTATAADEVSALAIIGTLPDVESLPPELRGRRNIGLFAGYAGSVEDGQKVLQPLRDLGEALLDISGVTPYVQMQSAFDGNYPTMRSYWKSLFIDSLSDGVIDQIVMQSETISSPQSILVVWHMGGAIQSVREEDSAFSGRDAPYLLSAEANWLDPQEDQAHIAWTRHCIEMAQPFSHGAQYFNFAEHNEGQDTMRKTFGAKYQRLAALKAKYDPTNLFRLNQNITPAP
jgi:hypothetical protein